MTTPAQLAGFKVGDKARVIATERQGLVGFSRGQIITLNVDDGSSNPLWAGSNSKYSIAYGADGSSIEGAYMSLSKLEKYNEDAEGPTEGVKWSEAPHGSTHYSMREPHYSKWHKFSDGHWYYYTASATGCWQKYGFQERAFPATQKKIPEEHLPKVCWKAGDVIRSVSDAGYDITIGNYYIVIKVEGACVYLRDDSSDSRRRLTSRYELVLSR